MDVKRILITGATDGIGKETAFQLAEAGHKVIVHGRTEQKAKETAGQVAADTGNKETEYVYADFSSFAEIKKMAKDINERFDRLDVLLNNAGVYKNKRETTEDGFESTFGVNHLAPFLLTHLLLGKLKESEPARIINVASMAHQRGEIDFDNLQGEKSYDGYSAYALSKLANILFTYELSEKLKEHDITVNSLHPGVINTKLLHAGFGGGGSSLKLGAETPVYLSVSDEVKDVTGKYFVRKKETSPAAAAEDENARKKLWEKSLEKTGIGDYLSTMK